MLLLGSGYALAGGDAPVPPIPESSPPSGRPARYWTTPNAKPFGATERHGDVLYADKAAPFVTNFHMVDTGKVTLRLCHGRVSGHPNGLGRRDWLCAPCHSILRPAIDACRDTPTA